MNKIFGLAAGILSGIIAASIWVYIDTIAHQDCYSYYKCESSWLYNFGFLKLVLILAIAGGVLGILISYTIDKKRK